MTSARPDLVRKIRKTLEVLYEPGDVFEIRILNTRSGTVRGCFDDLDAAARSVQTWDGRVPGIYVTLNPVVPDPLDLFENTLVEHAKTATKDDGSVRKSTSRAG